MKRFQLINQETYPKIPCVFEVRENDFLYRIISTKTNRIIGEILAVGRFTTMIFDDWTLDEMKCIIGFRNTLKELNNETNNL